MEYLLVKWLHILSASLLFGTGLGSAFYKWRSDRSNNLAAICATNRDVVLADWLFTTPAVVLQPATGLWLVQLSGITLSQPWLRLSLLLYVVAGLCWLPVLYLQIRMRAMAQQAHQQQRLLPATYYRLARTWFWLGIAAFSAVMATYLLMVVKPALQPLNGG